MTEPSDRHFCPQCGGGRALAAVFCEFCGARLASGDAATAAPPAVASWRVDVESLLRRDDLAGAEATLATVLAEHPDDPDAFALQAHIALERSDVESARELIDRAVALAPGSPFVRLQLADYWLRLGITPRARAELRRALHDCDGSDPALEAHLRRSIALVREHAKAEFGGVAAAGGFGSIGRAVQRLFQTKRARRRLDRLAGAAAADERGA